MNDLSRIFPWAVVAVAAVFLGLTATAPPEDQNQFHLQEFASLPVVDGGRAKPVDTFARTQLMLLTDGRQEFTDEKGKTHSAVEWLLDVMAMVAVRGSDEQLADERLAIATGERILRIDNDQVLNLLGLRQRWGYLYSVNEIRPQFAALRKEAVRAHELDEAKRDLFDNRVLDLAHKIERFFGLAELQVPLVVPPESGEGEWRSLGESLADVHGGTAAAAGQFHDILLAYGANKPKEFNEAVKAYREKVVAGLPESEVGKAGFEVFFNHFAPFYQCCILYVFVFALTALSWLGWRQPLRQAAFRLMVLTLAVHTFALVARMYIQGRPPVTNLYSSAVFIGWGCVNLGVFLERVYKNGFGNVVGSVMGAATLVIAHHLSLSGDTLEMMQAVLDTNFWLATHVTCVTLGYTATFVAGLLGITFVLAGLLTPAVDRNGLKTFGQMIYGVLCFATLLSFTGTVLGGIWADQSWGRFWGWDPKENGALLIVIWNALILHARWGGLVKTRGMAVLTIFGNMVTMWSWFGTNQLGIGLHAYGFNNTLVLVCRYFWLGQLPLIGLGLLPLKYWWSFRAAAGQTSHAPARSGRPALGTT
jgi:ABC-type transport system involved in cytochrome c biogenesis permease subunit